jgi:hypothetical protein
VNRINQIAEMYNYTVGDSQDGVEVSVAEDDIQFLLTALDECKVALDKNKLEWEIIAKNNETYKALVAWQMARNTLRKYWSDDES